MIRILYALLVGINDYPPPLTPLQGCVNDVENVKTFLEERARQTNYSLKLNVLENAQATRQNVIDGFRQHLLQARKDDIVLFYFSGHGSQEQALPEFWYLEPDKLNETLVCYDSRSEGQYDLADKELAKLIAEVAQRDPHIVVILDSCHSGSGTRNATLDGIRHAPPDPRQRPLSSYIMTSEGVAIKPRSAEQIKESSGWLLLPQGQHLLLAACRSNEEAKEYKLGGKMRGVFSYYLTDTLQQVGPTPTYRDLFNRTRTLTCNRAGMQNPQIEPTDLSMLDQKFLEGTLVEHNSYCTLSYLKEEGWTIDAGAVHGIPVPVGDETTRLALFPLTSTEEQIRKLSNALGAAHVTNVLPHLSKVRVTMDQGELDQKMTYKAIITASPLTPLGVHLSGDARGVQLARQALHTASPQDKPSLFVKEVAKDESELLMIAEHDEYIIMRPADDCPLVSTIKSYSEDTATQVIERLEHIARKMTVEELRNTDTRIGDAIRMELFYLENVPGTDDQPGQTVEIAAQYNELQLQYSFHQGKWIKPTFRVKLTNTGNRPLYCMVLDLTQTFAIDPALLGRGLWLNAGEEYWLNNGRSLYANIPNSLWRQGLSKFKDVLKLIVSTTECDATLLAQRDLDVSLRTRAVRGGSLGNTLNRLMYRVQTRHLSADPDNDETYTDWATQEFTIITMRPQESIALTPTWAELAPGIAVGGHPHLQGRARLTTLPLASRELGDVVLPPLLRDHPEMVKPLQFSPGWDGEPGMSLLELFDVNHADTVTPQQPLIVQLTGHLDQHEHVVPIGYDGELFLPLGYLHRKDEQTQEVLLERLPRPHNTRSLHGSIHILFQKVISKHFGKDFSYPRLAVAQGDDHHKKVSYMTDHAEVRNRVAAASRIVLYIHGILGDTHDMVRSTQRDAPERHISPVASGYDLILAFDYENIQTSIEETARALKHELTTVGLGAGHGKELHIIAHSMGGLVARWMIEREGGHEIVQQLVMLGTPNAGSPWSTIHGWATIMLQRCSKVLTPNLP